jgi:serine/threonine-protein kinase
MSSRAAIALARTDPKAVVSDRAARVTRGSRRASSITDVAIEPELASNGALIDYDLFLPFAAGGLATVHFGRKRAPTGFSRIVAIKRLRPEYAREPEFVAALIDEAHLLSRIRHPNVVPTLDVLSHSGELLLVMEYVHGISLAELFELTFASKEPIPEDVACGIAAGVLEGLHAAHEATTETGEPLGIVHRDVSPHNVLVGADGIARLVDFGVAKAVGRLQTTRPGLLKGKLMYMAPEQILCGDVTRRADLYSVSVLLHEALSGQLLFGDASEGKLLPRILEGEIPAPSSRRAGIDPAIDRAVMTGMARDPAERYETARVYAAHLDELGTASARRIAEWVERRSKDLLEPRAEMLAAIERGLAHPIDLGSEALEPRPDGFGSPPAPKRVASPVVVAAEEPDTLVAAPDSTARDSWRKVALAIAILLILTVAAIFMSRARAPLRAEAEAMVEPIDHAPAKPPSKAVETPAEPTPTQAASPLTAPEPLTPPAQPPRERKPHHRVERPKAKVEEAPDCQTPYWVDAEGIRHLRRECLR